VQVDAFAGTSLIEHRYLADAISHKSAVEEKSKAVYPAIVEELLKNFLARSCAAFGYRHKLAILLFLLKVLFDPLHALG
jgi:hypothetical protein